MSTEAAKMFLHAMIFIHQNYCLTNWSQANLSTLKPLGSQYKHKAIKILDKKTKLFHHCSILKKYQLLSWEDLQKYFNVCCVFKVCCECGQHAMYLVYLFFSLVVCILCSVVLPFLVSSVCSVMPCFVLLGSVLFMLCFFYLV